MSRFKQYLEAARGVINEENKNLEIVFRIAEKDNSLWQLAWAEDVTKPRFKSIESWEMINNRKKIITSNANAIGHNIKITNSYVVNGQELINKTLSDSQKDDLKELINAENWKGIADYVLENLI